jgi:hypothetical protein
VEFVRFEASTPNEHGLRPGIFWLTNKLARSGELAPEDWAWWRAANDWYDAAYPDPGKADPTLWDAALHPDVSCWFKATATHLLERVPGYLDLLDRYGVSWTERRSSSPGRVLYEDDVQVVVEWSSPAEQAGELLQCHEHAEFVVGRADRVRHPVVVDGHLGAARHRRQRGAHRHRALQLGIVRLEAGDFHDT